MGNKLSNSVGNKPSISKAFSKKFDEVVAKKDSYSSSDVNTLKVVKDSDCELCALAAKAIYNGQESFSLVLRSALREKGFKVHREKYFDGKLEDHHETETHQPMSTLIYGANEQGSSTMLITFRGSVTANDWSANADAAPIKSGLWHEDLPNVLVHKGWGGEIWHHFLLTMGSNGVREDGELTVAQLLKEYCVEKVLFAGHSLGGALAQVATLTAMVKLPKIVSESPTERSCPEVRAFVFASPMPFYFDKDNLKDSEEEILQRFRAKVHNVVFSLDVVPRIPGNHKWLKPCLEDFNELGNAMVNCKIPSFIPSFVASALITKYVRPFMESITSATEGKLKMFSKYRHASTLLLFDFNENSSIEAFSCFMVRSCTPEEFAALKYPEPNETFKAVLGVPAHSCLPEAVARNSFPDDMLTCMPAVETNGGAGEESQALPLPLPPVPPSPVADRTLETSQFLLTYTEAETPYNTQTLATNLRLSIKDHCTAYNIPFAFDEGEDFFKKLQAEMNMSNSMEEAVQHMWTSSQEIRGQKFCAILNGMLRDDHRDRIAPVAVLTRAINNLSVNPYSLENVCYRGGGFKDTYRNFFAPGREFRQPAFLSTSLQESVVDDFISNSSMPVKAKWRIHIDPMRKCLHLKVMTQHMPNQPDEEMYVFAPYSVFTVRSAQWKAGTNTDPHIIELDAAPDNMECPLGLPLAPWS